MEKREDISSILTTPSGLPLPISLRRQHPDDGIHPKSLVALNPNLQLAPQGDEKAAIQVEIGSTTSPPTEVVVLQPNLQLGESAAQRYEEAVAIQVAMEEDGSTSSPPAQFSAPINHINSITQAVRIEQAPPPILSHSYSNPKQVAILVGACLPLYISVLVKVILGRPSHSLIVNLFMIISTFAYAMAFLDLCALFWLYERLGHSNPSHQNTYLRCYRILKDVNIILCALVIIFTLLPLIIILIPHPHHPLPPPLTSTNTTIRLGVILF